MNWREWFEQQTTILGAATVVAVVSAIAGGELSWRAAIPILSGAATSMLLPEQRSSSTSKSQ